ncbi:hypothetical protein L227DRAFT_154232 [Lentinus tigrinus ALCF2SS1-6]|uniref:Uncharacterized protein n=1 Tax=Lentinus tigrinus ALCF2SS1-6 TaxID=1328759 RepID=A0A5C2S7C4_9APHY|nr:hypothetical protein L227DRAFT_154232 [Lentinus tigrinus ALCF2SS1-6]
MRFSYVRVRWTRPVTTPIIASTTRCTAIVRRGRLDGSGSFVFMTMLSHRRLPSPVPGRSRGGAMRAARYLSDGRQTESVCGCPRYRRHGRLTRSKRASAFAPPREKDRQNGASAKRLSSTRTCSICSKQTPRREPSLLSPGADEVRLLDRY